MDPMTKLNVRLTTDIYRACRRASKRGLPLPSVLIAQLNALLMAATAYGGKRYARDLLGTGLLELGIDQPHQPENTDD